MKQLTVVIPVWGTYLQFLPKCIASIADDPAVDRVIVVDNASTELLPILQSKVQIIRLPQRVGLAAARNAGLRQVDTPFVAFLDADDQAIPGGYQALLDSISSDKSCVAAVGQLMNARAAGQKAPNPWPGRAEVTAARRQRRFALRGLWKYSFPTCSGAVLRTAAVRAVGGFGDVRYHEDWVLSVLLSWQGKVKFVAKSAAIYRLAENSRLHHLSKSELQQTRREVQAYILSHHATPAMLRTLKRPYLWYEHHFAPSPPVH